MMYLFVPFLLLCLNPTTAFLSGGHHAVKLTAPAFPNEGTLRESASPRQTVVLQASASSGGGDVKSLLEANRAVVDALASVSASAAVPELTRLRFALAFSTLAQAKRALRFSVAYRRGTGKALVESAAVAVREATAGGGWDNEAVRAAAPHAAIINQYITPKNILTLSTDDGDLLYVIRASLIKDKELMSKVSVAQMGEFFLYVKEVHNIVADARSERSGRLCEVIFANDISGVKAIPDPDFSKALTESSKQYERLYPSLAGPTMIVNLPFVLQAFIGLIKPLFPKTVQERLLFESAPFLARLKELTPLTTDKGSRESFLAEIKRLLQ